MSAALPYVVSKASTGANATKQRYGDGVDGTDIIARLKGMEPELREAGLGALYLFGSRARGDHRPDSDVDLLFEVSAEADARFNLLDQATLINLLADRLEANVDLVERRALLLPFRALVEPDLVCVFG